MLMNTGGNGLGGHKQIWDLVQPGPLVSLVNCFDSYCKICINIVLHLQELIEKRQAMIDEFTKYLARLEEQWVEEKPIRLELRDGMNKNCFDVCINKHHVTLSWYSATHSCVVCLPFFTLEQFHRSISSRND